MEGFFDAGSRVRFDELGFYGPLKYPSQRVEGSGELGAAFLVMLAAGDDDCRCDPGDRLHACRLGMTCWKIFSRWRLVAVESDAHAVVSR